ncbi:MAG TPA: Gfo/Idh/MocA family oxidoreductase [Armatimonadota bacterium]|nr:Gfo/Idh/MocA family oxidoreductase [Armatimonadota bacterium]
MGNRVKIGIIGCGAISANYLKNAQNLPILEVTACADLELERARARAEEFGVPRACTVEELLADDDVEMVLNLTIPGAHAPLVLQALEHGKHTYVEKPLSISRDEAKAVLEAAQARSLRVGCAPDTFLGAGLQTARKVLDDGLIGRPVAFTAFMLGRGPEGFHPNPEFFYQPGGGPMFDMGPYYVTALLNLLGPLKRLSGAASVAIPDRTVKTGPKEGQKIQVDTPDHVCGTMEFESGAIGTLITSFAVTHGVYDRQFPITVYGTDGALKVPDPNMFDGPVQVRRTGDEEWTEVPHAFVTGYGRSVGLADMAHALRSGRPHRCSVEQAFLTLDIMQGFLDSSREERSRTPAIPYERPAPMPAELPFGVLDD